MAAVHILIFGEMAGFKIIPFIATHVKMIFFFFFFFFFSWSYEKKFSANQNSPICMKTTDIKLFDYEDWFTLVIGMTSSWPQQENSKIY